MYLDQQGVFTTAAGRRIGWAERGPADGAPLGYLHGIPGSRRDLEGIFTDDALRRFGLRVFSIDRAGYGDTDAVGLDRRDVAADLLAIADHLAIDRFAVLAISMGGTYALTVAALSPERVTRLVLAVPQALPYDDPEVIAAFDADDQEEIIASQAGPSPELEETYAEDARSLAGDSLPLLEQVAERWSAHEQRLVASGWGRAVADSLAFGLKAGHVGYYEDALRAVRPLEVDPRDVTCPVRIISASLDHWEPPINARRLSAILDDVALVELRDMGHFGPWVWPEMVLGLLVGG